MKKERVGKKGKEWEGVGGKMGNEGREVKEVQNTEGGQALVQRHNRGQLNPCTILLPFHFNIVFEFKFRKGNAVINKW